ncbi:predicted protein [Sclerotinia sclerotiorum 1980 UF-70]|uniref:Uncharacterized protein n=1 Tax=Sclerotinia sclerotiorum (strain ATCC 18683 / 1980 / Ss-1) TaxID=665079 RepID=A7E8W1_SCLS1|nr:predicted protein [Sclerotinia sclerotiorum 1980 UF-70]EDN96813.1 predicted protein [Sclerotinia sclerotiorum 1980 UF-70]
MMRIENEDNGKDMKGVMVRKKVSEGAGLYKLSSLVRRVRMNGEYEDDEMVVRVY